MVTSTPPAACTAACTSEGEIANACAPDADQVERDGVLAGDRAEPAEATAADQGDRDQGLTDDRSDRGDQNPGAAGGQADPLVVLAAAIAGLSPGDRARLAGLLAGTP